MGTQKYNSPKELLPSLCMCTYPKLILHPNSDCRKMMCSDFVLSF